MGCQKQCLVTNVVSPNVSHSDKISFTKSAFMIATWTWPTVSTLNWPLTFSKMSCVPRRWVTVPLRLSGTSSTEEISAQTEQLTRYWLREPLFHHSWKPTVHTFINIITTSARCFLTFLLEKKNRIWSVLSNFKNCQWLRFQPDTVMVYVLIRKIGHVVLRKELIHSCFHLCFKITH